MGRVWRHSALRGASFPDVINRLHKNCRTAPALCDPVLFTCVFTPLKIPQSVKNAPSRLQAQHVTHSHSLTRIGKWANTVRGMNEKSFFGMTCLMTQSYYSS